MGNQQANLQAALGQVPDPIGTLLEQLGLFHDTFLRQQRELGEDRHRLQQERDQFDERVAAEQKNLKDAQDQLAAVRKKFEEDKKEQEEKMATRFSMARTELKNGLDALEAEKLQLAEQQDALKTDQDVLNNRMRQFENDLSNFNQMREEKSGEDEENFQKRMKDLQDKEVDCSKKSKALQDCLKECENLCAQLKTAQDGVAKKQEDQKKEEEKRVRASQIEKENEKIKEEVAEFKRTIDQLQSENNSQLARIETLDSLNKVILEDNQLLHQEFLRRGIQMNDLHGENAERNDEAADEDQNATQAHPIENAAPVNPDVEPVNDGIMSYDELTQALQLAHLEITRLDEELQRKVQEEEQLAQTRANLRTEQRIIEAQGEQLAAERRAFELRVQNYMPPIGNNPLQLEREVPDVPVDHFEIINNLMAELDTEREKCRILDSDRTDLQQEVQNLQLQGNQQGNPVRFDGELFGASEEAERLQEELRKQMEARDTEVDMLAKRYDGLTAAYVTLQNENVALRARAPNAPVAQGFLRRNGVEVNIEDNLTTQMRSLEENRQLLNVQQTNLQTRQEDLASQFKLLDENRQMLTVAQEELQTDQISLATRELQLEEDRSKLDQQKSQHITAQKSLEERERLVKIGEDRLKKKFEQLESDKEELETLKQKHHNQHLKKLGELEELRLSIPANKEKLGEKQKEINKDQKQLDGEQKDSEASCNKVDRLKEIVTKLNTELNTTKAQLSNAMLDKDDLMEARKEIENLKKQLKEKEEAKIDELAEQVKKVSDAYFQLKKDEGVDMKDIKKRLDRVVDDVKRLTYSYRKHRNEGDGAQGEELEEPRAKKRKIAREENGENSG